jgi:type I pantothenate kinase
VLQAAAWADLATDTEIALDEETLARLRGSDDPTMAWTSTEVYLPLTQLLHLYVVNTGTSSQQTHDFLARGPERRTPFVIGVAGSVAVGKSTGARLLQELLRRAPGPRRSTW